MNPNRTQPEKTSRRGQEAFTLIEMLVVIAIIAVLAAMIFPAFNGIKRNMLEKKAFVEMASVESTVEAYKAKLGHYPPDNANSVVTNQLFYELKGVTNQGTFFSTLGGEIQILTADVPRFGVAGFVNCSRGGGDEAVRATDFARNLKAGQFLDAPTHEVLGSTIPGPFMYTNSSGKMINPWRYSLSSPTNNANGYDMWLDIFVGAKTKRISNWNKKAIALD